MITGSTLPILSWVRALNCLQNSMILIPLEPNAGPIGGAGLAWPPLHCSFTKPVLSFAILYDLLVQTTFLPYQITWSPKFLSRFTGSERTYGAAKIRYNQLLRNCFTKIFLE